MGRGGVGGGGVVEETNISKYVNSFLSTSMVESNKGHN